MKIPINPIAFEIVRTEQSLNDLDIQVAELMARRAEYASVIGGLESTGLAEWEEVIPPVVEETPPVVEPDGGVE